jgi:hypothetical protein
VQHRRAQRCQRLQSAGARCSCIQSGAAAARVPGQAHRTRLRKALQRLRIGRLEEQHRGHAGQRQCLHRVGGAGEVVAVVGEQQA